MALSRMIRAGMRRSVRTSRHQRHPQRGCKAVAQQSGPAADVAWHAPQHPRL